MIPAYVYFFYCIFQITDCFLKINCGRFSQQDVITILFMLYEKKLYVLFVHSISTFFFEDAFIPSEVCKKHNPFFWIINSSIELAALSAENEPKMFLDFYSNSNNCWFCCCCSCCRTHCCYFVVLVIVIVVAVVATETVPQVFHVKNVHSELWMSCRCSYILKFGYRLHCINLTTLQTLNQ